MTATITDLPGDLVTSWRCTATCPDCEGVLQLLTEPAGSDRARTAQLRCTECDAEWLLSIRLGSKPGPSKAARLPWAPVEHEIEKLRGDVVHGQQQRGMAELVARSQARTADASSSPLHRSRLHKWKAEGVTLDAADRIAHALDKHPWEIWGEDYYQLGCEVSA